MKARLASVVIVSLLLVSGTIDPKKDDAKYVEFGKKFPFVARLVCKPRGGGPEHDASCVLIGDRWAVTAAHVVDGMDEWVVITDDGARHELEGVSIHEGYRRGDFSRGDIAVCRSKDDFDLDWYPPLYDGDDESGKTATIAGFGMSGTLLSGRTVLSDGTRRAGTNRIDDVKDGYIVCSTTDNPSSSLEFHIAPGDSGGGLFIVNSLAGINSHVSVSGSNPPKGVYGEESGHTRISEYRDWIAKETQCDE